MTWSTYDPLTGIVTSRVRNENQLLDRPAVPGDWSPGRYYVREGQVRPLPPCADPSLYTWNLDQEQWVLDPAACDRQARATRADLLTAVDRVNPMWWQSLDGERQAQVSAYRQALLDITRQPGYPITISWPVTPAWLPQITQKR